MAATAIIEASPADLPVVPKLVADRNSGRDVESDTLQINRGVLESIYSKVCSVRTNNKHTIQLFPDIELAIQILVTSILSPKKMTDIQLNYRFNKNFSVNPSITTGILEEVKTYVEENYELEDKLPDIVREALFVSGACVYAIISEAAVDELINSDLLPNYSIEEYKTRVDTVIKKVTEPINLINLSQVNSQKLEDKISAENFVNFLASDNNVKVTDNVGILRFSEVKEKISSSILRKELRRGSAISQESLDKINYLDVFRTKGNPGYKQVETIKNKDETHRKSIGKPMVSKFPTESVIPVFVPGNEKEHVGYFVLLDENYKPMSSGMSSSDMNRLDTSLHTKTSGTLTPVQKAYNNLISNTSDSVDLNSLFEMYKGVLERQLFSTIKSSLNGKAINIAEKNDIYFLMFSRALQEQKTSILYIPKDLVVYFAFQFNETGVGKSLLENLAVQTSLRAILLFAKVMGYAKQSIDVTKVNIELDPNDPDPEKTIEQVQSSVLKLRQNFLPLGINNPVDLVNWIQRAGLQFSYSNNPMIPNVNVTFENGGTGHTLPSTDLDEELRKQTIIALGLPPETIDNSFSPEFAKSVVNNNILLSKRVSVYQEKLNKDISKFVSTIIYNDEDIRTKIKELILEKIDEIIRSSEEDEKHLYSKDPEAFIDYYIDKISDNIYIELPKPEDTDIVNLSAEFELYKQNLEIVIESILSSELFSDDVAGDISAHMDSIKNLYKNYLLRKWMSDNNYYPEVLDIASDNQEDMDGLLESLTTHMSSTMRNSGKLMRLMKDFKSASNKDLDNTLNGEEATPTSSDSSSSQEPEEESQDDGLGGNPDDFLNL